MISYEISLGLILITLLFCVGSLNFVDIVYFQCFVFFCIPFFVLFLMFLISILAETNRAPFDLPEAESELVSGFNVEYSSMGFALFFFSRIWFYHINESFYDNIVFGWVNHYEIFHDIHYRLFDFKHQNRIYIMFLYLG
jgi:NADH:ubiquinone oxidoreductase subunit H